MSPTCWWWWSAVYWSEVNQKLGESQWLKPEDSQRRAERSWTTFHEVFASAQITSWEKKHFHRKCSIACLKIQTAYKKLD